MRACTAALSIRSAVSPPYGFCLVAMAISSASAAFLREALLTGCVLVVSMPRDLERKASIVRAARLRY